MTIVSPNHVEALALCGYIPSPFTSDSQLVELLGDSMWAKLERCGQTLLEEMLRPSSSWDSATQHGWKRGVVIRCGVHGCLVFEQGSTTKAPVKIPVFWTEGQQDQVLDVTGGGNAFLGGFVAGMDLTDGQDLVSGKIHPLSLSLPLFSLHRSYFFGHTRP